MTRRQLLCLLGSLGALALYALLAWIEYRPEPRGLLGDEVWYWEVATGEELSATVDGVPDLLWPPGYSWFLATLASTAAERWRVQLAQAVLLVATAFLWRLLWLRWVGTRAGGWCLFFLLLLYPVLPAYTFYFWPEIAHLFLATLAVWIVVARRDAGRWLLLLGLVLGAARLTKALLGPFLLVFLLPLLLDGSWRRRAARVAVVLGAYLAITVPVAVHHGRVHGVYAVSDSFHFNLWGGLLDQSRRNYDGGVVQTLYAYYRGIEGDWNDRRAYLEASVEDVITTKGWGTIVVERLDVQYFRLFDRVSLLGDMLPGGAAERFDGGYRDPPGWVARFLRRWSYLLYGAVLLGSVLGLIVGPWRRSPWMWGMAAFVGYNLALFLLLHVKSRYRVQLLPILMFWSVMGASWGLDRERVWPARWRWVAGGLAALVLCYLAFGRGLLF